MNANMKWAPLGEDRTSYVYSVDGNEDVARGCIGHLRGDFGRDGDEFWTSWFDHQHELKSAAFRDELDDVVNNARKKGGLLHNFSSMLKECQNGTRIDDGCYAFQLQTNDYEYCLRCTPRRGDYNFYLYCYDMNARK